MFPRAKTQDLLLQNQSMRMVEETLGPINQHAVLLARSRYLQSVMPTPIVGTAGVVLMFYFLAGAQNQNSDMLIWLCLGLVTTLWRSYLLFSYKSLFKENPQINQLTRYLQQVTATAVVAGVTFGWGWLSIYENMSSEIQMGYLFTNILMLFGGLYAYSPHLPAYISFSLFSLAPALWQVQQNATLWLAQTVGITLVALVSQMFAFRWAQNFRHNVLLQEKNADLLQELIEKKELAEKATRAKSRFLASVSHDLRQPLHAINLYLVVLKRSISSSPNPHLTEAEQQEITNTSVSQLEESATQLTRMFEALLDISKLDAGTTQANVTPINVTGMIRQLASEYSQLAAQSGLSFDLQLPEQLDQVLVMADSIVLERILRNLLSNATGHTIQGGVRLRLKVRRIADESRLEFRVVDTGPGIKVSDRVRIFEEFYQTEAARKQAANTQRKTKNLGLGLAISSRLARLLNTDIRLYTYLGKGSVFAFDLAFQPNTKLQSVSDLQAIKDNKTDDYQALRGACVFVVDDEPSILDATQKLLQSYGAMAITAESVQQTWQALEQLEKEPALFLVDNGLGTEPGLDLIRSIKEKYGDNKPCILITGDTSAEQVSKFTEAKQLVLYKPLTEHLLIQTMINVLGKHTSE